MQSGWFSKRPSHFWVKEARHKLSQMFLFILISERGKTNPCCEDSGQGFHLGEEILTQIWVCSLWKNSSNARFSLSASPFVSGDALFLQFGMNLGVTLGAILFTQPLRLEDPSTPGTGGTVVSKTDTDLLSHSLESHGERDILPTRWAQLQVRYHIYKLQKLEIAQ